MVRFELGNDYFVDCEDHYGDVSDESVIFSVEDEESLYNEYYK